MHIHQGGNTNVQFQMTTANTGSSNATDGLGIGIIDATMNVEFRLYEAAAMLFYTNDAERMRILSGGDVGIGTTSPIARLQVTAEIPVATIASTTGALVQADGNGYAGNVVGIEVEANDAESGGGATIGIHIESNGTDVNTTGIFAEVLGSKAGTNPTRSVTGGSFSAGAGNFNGVVESYGVIGLGRGGFTGTGGATYGGYFDGDAGSPLCIGVRGSAGNGTSNYGVYGVTASNSNCNTGTSGAVCSNAAGYFVGNLVYTGAFGVVSDSKFKNNVNTIDSASYFLSKLQPHSYFYDTAAYPQMNLPIGKHYGLIAQELDSTLPNLVDDYIQPMEIDSSGNIIHPEVYYKAVNYIELITILIAGHQNQQAEIDSLSQLVSLFTGQKQGGQTNPIDPAKKLEVTLTNKLGVILNQNDPNPFKENTVITYFIPDEVKNAKIIFHNLCLRPILIGEFFQKSLG